MKREDIKLAVVAGFAVVVGMAGPGVADDVQGAVSGRASGNAHTVDGKHAVGAGATPADRAGKLVATDKKGWLPNDIIRKAPNSELLNKQRPGFYTTRWLNVSSDGSIRSMSVGMEGTTVIKHADPGRYCIVLPDNLNVSTEAVSGTIQETLGGTNRYDIAVTTTFGNACNSVGGWDIAVLTHINGAAANGSFMILIPGTPQLS